MNNLLSLRGVTKKYNHFYALNNVSFDIPSGEIIGLMGPNGSGKTTLIKLINDCLAPTSGDIFVGGFPVGVRSKELISYLPDVMALNEAMTIQELTEFYNDFYSDFSKNKAFAMLRDLAIDPRQKLKLLSKGTKEKVQLVLVMSRQALLYILDEPIGGVDPASRDYILKTIISNYSENASVLISTHLISDIENVLDRALFLKQGQIVLNQTVDEIREQSGSSVDQLFREVFRC